MNHIKKFFTYLIYYPERILLHLWDILAPIIPDKLFLAVRYRLVMGYWMDFCNPTTFTEKLQWLKLNDRRPEYTQMVDKYAVKHYVSEIIGEEYIIPTIGIWDKPEQIDWKNMPNQFVLKTTDGGGNYGVVVVKDKNNIDKNFIVNKLNKALKQDIYLQLREWPYKNVSKRIIAEQYIADNLNDYKFYCFNGEPKILLVASNRNTTHNFDYYDLSFQHLDITSRSGAKSSNPIEKPKNFELMKDIVIKLAKDIPHVRVDLYNHEGKIFFGELTFFDSSGYDDMNSEEWNIRMGEWIELQNICA